MEQHIIDKWANSEERIRTEGKDINITPSFNLITWNVNGIRALQNADNPESMKVLLDAFGADIICLQETKVTRDKLDEKLAHVEGYNAYFAFSKNKAGYSGVVTYCKDGAVPIRAEEGVTGYFVRPMDGDKVGNYNPEMDREFVQFELKELDFEGRAMITEHKIIVPEQPYSRDECLERWLVVINVYCPRSDKTKPEREKFRTDFCHLLEMRVRMLSAAGKLVMVVGDLNIVHRPIDTYEDVSEDPAFHANRLRNWLNNLLFSYPKYHLYNTQNQGFYISLPLNTTEPVLKFGLLNAAGNRTEISFPLDTIFSGVNKIPVLVDAFRYHHKKMKAFTCWNTRTNARATNRGTRIDFVLVCAKTLPFVTRCNILREIQGSDHCPVRATIQGTLIANSTFPSICTKHFLEFAGKQTRLTSVFKKCTANEAFSSESNRNAVPSTVNSRAGPSVPKANRKSTCTQTKVTHFCTRPVSVKPKVATTTTSDGTTQEADSANNWILPDAPAFWKKLFMGPRPAPLCKGHREPCVEKTVKKKGLYYNRKYWVCARKVGPRDESSPSCSHFSWKKYN